MKIEPTPLELEVLKETIKLSVSFSSVMRFAKHLTI